MEEGEGVERKEGGGGGCGELLRWQNQYGFCISKKFFSRQCIASVRNHYWLGVVISVLMAFQVTRLSTSNNNNYNNNNNNNNNNFIDVLIG